MRDDFSCQQLRRAMNGFGLHSTEVQPENEMPVINTGLILLDQVNQIAWCAKKQLVAFLKLVHFVMNVTAKIGRAACRDRREGRHLLGTVSLRCDSGSVR